MNLKEYLSGKGKLPKGKTTDWLPFCTMDVSTGSLWAGDPHLANADDGCVVKVPRGKYLLEGVGLAFGRDRAVSRFRARLDTAIKPKLGKAVGETGTDSAMIGVCDIKAFDAACRQASGDEVQEAIESQTQDGFGIITIKKFPGTIMPFIPTGSDGTGPVFALISSGKCIGIELSFTEEDDIDEDSAEDIQELSLLGEDTEHSKTWALAEGGEVTCWVGGEIRAGTDLHIWSDRFPRVGRGARSWQVAYRIRRGKNQVLKDWAPMAKQRGGGASFGAVEVLNAGKYEIDFKIGKEIFSAIRLVLK